LLQHLADRHVAPLPDAPLVELVVAGDALVLHEPHQLVEGAVEAGLVVELLARQVAEHVAYGPARGAGRPPPALLVELREEPVEPGRLGVEDVERVVLAQQVLCHNGTLPAGSRISPGTAKARPESGRAFCSVLLLSAADQCCRLAAPVVDAHVLGTARGLVQPVVALEDGLVGAAAEGAILDGELAPPVGAVGLDPLPGAGAGGAEVDVDLLAVDGTPAPALLVDQPAGEADGLALADARR